MHACAKKKLNYRLEHSNVHNTTADKITSALFRLKTQLYEINIIIKCDGAYIIQNIILTRQFYHNKRIRIFMHID